MSLQSLISHPLAHSSAELFSVFKLTVSNDILNETPRFALDMEGLMSWSVCSCVYIGGMCRYVSSVCLLSQAIREGLP